MNINKQFKRCKSLLFLYVIISLTFGIQNALISPAHTNLKPIAPPVTPHDIACTYSPRSTTTRLALVVPVLCNFANILTNLDLFDLIPGNSLSLICFHIWPLIWYRVLTIFFQRKPFQRPLIKSFKFTKSRLLMFTIRTIPENLQE